METKSNAKLKALFIIPSITGIILFFLLGSEFFVNYTVHFRGKKVSK